MKTKTVLVFLSLCLSIASALTPFASAATLYWDADGNPVGNEIISGTGLGGSGQWDVANPFWFDSLNDVPWVNSNNDDAVFMGTPGTVTLTTNIVARSILFTNASGYILDGGTLSFSTNNGAIDTGASDQTINSVIDGSAGFTKTGTGALLLGGTNLYAGTTTVNEGILRLNTSDVIPNTSTVNVGTNGALDLNNFEETIGALAGAGLATMGAGNLTIGANNSSQTFSGVLSGSGNLTKIGTATQTFSGTNLYTGKTIILGGKLSVGADVHLGAVPGASTPDSIQLSNGTLRASASFTLNSARGITLTDNGTIEVTGTRNLTYSGIMGGAGSLTKTGTGTLTLGANNTFTGQLSIDSGVVSINNSTRIPSGTAPIVIDGGTLRSTLFGIGVTYVNSSHPIQVGPGGGVFDITGQSGGTNTILFWIGTVTGTGTLTKSGVGELRVYGGNLTNNTFSKLVISGGTYTLGQSTNPGYDEAYGGPPATLLTDAVTIQNNATNRVVGSVDITMHTNRGVVMGPGGGFFLTDGHALTIPGPLSGTNNLTKAGSQTLTLNGSNTNFTGKITVLSGPLAINSDIALGAAPSSFVSNAVTLNGGSLRVTANTTMNTNRGITMLANGTLDVNSSRTLTFNGSIEGLGTNNLTKIGSGTLRIGGTGTNNFNNMILSAGTLSLDKDNALGSGLFDISGNGVTVRAATGTARSLTNAIKFTATGFNFAGSGPLAFSGDVNLGATSTAITNSSTGIVTFAGSLTNTAGLLFRGTGTTILTGNNSYAGTTTVEGGRLFVSNSTGSGTGSASVTVVSNATLGGTGTVAGSITVANALLAAGGPSSSINAVGKLTVQNGVDLANGATNVWELGALKDDMDGVPGQDFDQVSVTGGNLVLGGSSRLLIAFTNAALAPDFAVPFWQTSHKWTVIKLSGSASNPSLAGFIGVDTNTFYYAGSFSTTVEPDGSISLNFAPSGPTAPIILQQPKNKTVIQESNATFNVSATGTAPLSYQWYFNNVPVPDATNSSLTITGATPLNEGNYFATVANASGSATSSVATLTVLVPPTITSQPQSQNVEPGATNVTFSVTATGTLPLSYQWKKDGVNISGATTNSYVLSTVTTNDAATYSVVVTNVAGSATSTGAVLTVGVVSTPPLLSISLTNNVVTLLWTSISNRVYRPQFKDDLNLTNWTDIPPDVTATSTNTVITNNVTGQNERFYRVLLLP